jgi:hypothetical protein
MPMNFDFRKCENLTEETKDIFFTGGSIYNAFQTLCNWLYQTKFCYSDRKRDSFLEDNLIIMKEEHVNQIIESKLFRAVDPEKYNEETLKSMLSEFIGLKVWAT